jgi:hypothetical protein
LKRKFNRRIFTELFTDGGSGGGGCDESGGGGGTFIKGIGG